MVLASVEEEPARDGSSHGAIKEECGYCPTSFVSKINEKHLVYLVTSRAPPAQLLVTKTGQLVPSCHTWPSFRLTACFATIAVGLIKDSGFTQRTCLPVSLAATPPTPVPGTACVHMARGSSSPSPGLRQRRRSCPRPGWEASGRVALLG